MYYVGIFNVQCSNLDQQFVFRKDKIDCRKKCRTLFTSVTRRVTFIHYRLMIMSRVTEVTLLLILLRLNIKIEDSGMGFTSELIHNGTKTTINLTRLFMRYVVIIKAI